MKNKKKLLSALLSATMLLSSGYYSAWAEENSIKKVYADNYGLDIVYSGNVTESDYQGLSFAAADGNAVSYSVAAENNILHLNFASQIETDKHYVLSVGGVTKKVTVKRVADFEDFENMEPNAAGDIFHSIYSNPSGKWVASAGVGTFVTDASEKFALSSKKLAISDGSWYSLLSMPNDVTLSVDMSLYKRDYINDNGTKSNGEIAARLGVRSASAGYTDCYGLDIEYDGKAKVGVHDAAGGLGYSMASGYVVQNSTATGIGVINVPSTTAETPSNDDFNNFNFTVEPKGEEARYVLRNYDNVIGGYYDGQYIGTVVDDKSRYPRNDKKYTVMQGYKCTIMLVDNIEITTCEVADIELKMLPVESVYADTFHFELQLSEEISGTSIAGMDKISLTNVTTGEPVSFTAEDIAVNGKTFRVNVPLASGNKYLLEVEPGFGTVDTKVSNAVSKTFGIKTIYDQNFDDNPENVVGTLVRAAYADQVKTQDGKLWINSTEIAPIAEDLINYENATFSYDQELYAPIDNGNFQDEATWNCYGNRTYSETYVGFNAQDLTIGGAADTRFTLSNSKTKPFYWRVFATNQLRGQSNGQYTVVTPAEGSSYAAGDVYTNSEATYEPSAATGTFDGVGTVNFGEHYKQTDHELFAHGDAIFANGTITVYHKGDTLPTQYKYMMPDGSYVTTSQRDAVAKHMRVEKQGDTAALCYDGVVTDRYTTGGAKTGYFCLKNSWTMLAAYDNMLITVYEETKTSNKVELVNADCETVVVNTGINFGEISNLGKIKITNINTKENAVINSASYTNTDLYLETSLTEGVPYKITIENGLEGSAGMYLGDDYSAFFKVNKTLSVNAANTEDLAKIDLTPTSSRWIENGNRLAGNFSIITPEYKNASIKLKIAYYTHGTESDGTPKKGMFNLILFKEDGTSSSWNPSELSNGTMGLYMNAENMESAMVYAKDVQGNVLQNGDKEIFKEARPTGNTQGEVKEDKIIYTSTVEPHTEKYMITNDTYRTYKEGNLIWDKYQPGLRENGKFIIYASGVATKQLYTLEVTQMELLDTINLNVTDITADANKLYVKFSENVAAATDFTKINVTKDGQDISISGIANGNTVEITPDGGIVSDAVYEVSVLKGFGPNDITFTTKDVSKRLAVTVYVNEKFDGGKVTDGSKLRVDGAAVQYTDGGVIVHDGGFYINDADFAGAEDYTVKYDYKLYAALTDSYDDVEKVPYSQLWFNAPTDADRYPDTGYFWIFGNDGVTPRTMVDGSGSNGEVAKFAEKKTEFGDAYAENDGTITIFKEGEEIADYGFLDANGDPVLYSARSPKLYQYEIDKSGLGATLKRDGNAVSTFTGNESADITAATGYFGFRAQQTEIMWLDNIQAYNVYEVTGIHTVIDAANNKVIVNNYDAGAKNGIIVVSSYDSNNRMIDSFATSAMDFASGASEISYELNTTGAAKIKAFCWDNLTDLTPYCKAAEHKF